MENYHSSVFLVTPYLNADFTYQEMNFYKQEQAYLNAGRSL